MSSRVLINGGPTTARTTVSSQSCRGRDADRHFKGESRVEKVGLSLIRTWKVITIDWFDKILFLKKRSGVVRHWNRSGLSTSVWLPTPTVPYLSDILESVILRASRWLRKGRGLSLIGLRARGRNGTYRDKNVIIGDNLRCASHTKLKRLWIQRFIIPSLDMYIEFDAQGLDAA